MIILLLVAGYVIVGGVINTSETLIKAHYDASAEISKQVGTDIRLNNSYIMQEGYWDWENGEPIINGYYYLWIDVRNVGRVPITYPLDLILIDKDGPRYYADDDVLTTKEFIDTVSGEKETKNTINQGVLDPGEGVGIGIRLTTPDYEPYWGEVITKNGISSSAYLTNLTNITPTS